MKAVVVLALLTGALSAPTATLKRDLASFDSASFGALIARAPAPTGGFDLADFLSGLSSKSATPSSTASSSGSGSLADLFSSFLGGGSDSNGVTANSGCNPLTFIFARGTTELGTMGTVVGPEVASALSASTKVTVQGVDYPASALGNAALGGEGGPEMAKLVEQALQQCPKTKVVLGGYSQGAMVVHNAASKLQDGQVVGAVTFGDPFKALKPDHIPQFKTFCADGDPVCENGFNVLAHLTYGSNAKEAAQFLLQAAGL